MKSRFISRIRELENYSSEVDCGVVVRLLVPECLRVAVRPRGVVFISLITLMSFMSPIFRRPLLLAAGDKEERKERKG